MKSKEDSIPPKLPVAFLRWFCSADLLEDVEGDLSELFSQRTEQSISKARILYSLDVLLLFRPGIIKNVEFKTGLINTAMIKNYLKIAARNALRYKGFTALNLLGLIVGIASSMLILLWLDDEVKVNRFHEKGEKIYQVFRNMRQANGVVETTESIPKPAADLMQAEYSEVTDVALYSWGMRRLLESGEKITQEEGRYVTPSFLDMFSFPLILGDKTTALDDLNAILISKRLAIKYFGAEWKEKSLGSSIRVADIYDAVVSGVFEEPGDRSTLNFEWLLPAQTFFNYNEWVDNWGNGSFQTFFTVDSEAAAQAVAKRVYDEIKVHTVDNNMAGDETLVIQKFEDTYLYSNFDNGVISGGRIDYVRIMTVVAVFLLIVACINFMNLATARSGRRSKEIGLRKVMGAHKGSISFQFFLESILLSFLALTLSVVLVMLVLPFFSLLVDKNLLLDLTDSSVWLFMLSLGTIVGLLSGSYPALMLPAFRIIDAIKGSVKQSPSAGYFRRGLVVFQFAISTLLIIGTAVIYDQIQFVLSKDLGMDKDNMVAVWMEGDLSDRYQTYKTEIAKIPEVKAVTVASGNPIRYGRSTSSANWEGKDPSKGYEINVMLTDEVFISTMGMEIIRGRDFSEQISDSTNFIVNEVAAELMGFDDPIDKSLSFWGIDGKIIGVVKNFHMRNMYSPIAPVIISCIDPTSSAAALVRLEGNPMKGLAEIEKITKELNPVFDFDYDFLDQTYEESYRSEITVGTLARIFSGISIFISCLGLFGLSAFSAEQRSKEIGVRKVHGASTTQLVLLLSKDYTKLMLIAFVVAIPFGYYYAQDWLDNFEFRSSLSASVFVTAGIATFVIAVVTVSFKSFQAARANPVHTLRDE